MASATITIGASSAVSAATQPSEPGVLKPYNNVHALMLAWKGSGQDDFRRQRKTLGDELKLWNYGVEDYDILNDAMAHRDLNHRLNNFLRAYDKPGTLLILYYGGHGFNDEDQTNVWLW